MLISCYLSEFVFSGNYKNLNGYMVSHLFNVADNLLDCQSGHTSQFFWIVICDAESYTTSPFLLRNIWRMPTHGLYLCKALILFAGKEYGVVTIVIIFNWAMS